MISAVLVIALTTACSDGERRGRQAGSTVATTGVSPSSSTERPFPDARSSGSVVSVGETAIPRAVHTATLLEDGRVLVAGGCTADGCGDTERGQASELFDPATQRFSPGPRMTIPRVGHTATRLLDGRVLVVGGYRGEGTEPEPTAELFDPVRDRWRRAGRLTVARAAHTSVLLADGRVLVVGGVSGRNDFAVSAEIFEPADGSFRRVAAPATAHAAAAATRVADGRVLVLGGQTDAGQVTDLIEAYDPARDRWTTAGRLGTARYKHGAVTLRTGDVLVVGGGEPAGDQDRKLPTAELVDPRTGASRATADLVDARYKLPDAVTVLDDGRVLVAGGSSRAEVFDPTQDRFTAVHGSLGDVRSFATSTRLTDGRVLIVGGYDSRIAVEGEAFLYGPS